MFMGDMSVENIFVDGTVFGGPLTCTAGSIQRMLCFTMFSMWLSDAQVGTRRGGDSDFLDCVVGSKNEKCHVMNLCDVMMLLC
jgi:hypothetical protein